MRTLEEFQARALCEVRSDDFRKALDHLFGRFSLEKARKLVLATNRLRGSSVAFKEKGAVGAAVVAATMSHFFGHYNGYGFFDFEYDYWGDRDPDALLPVRRMDIIFIMPTLHSKRGSVAFQVEVKNHNNVTVATLTSNRSIKTQLQKDHRYLNPGIQGHAPLVPVWWFLQALDSSARHHLENLGIRVIDFMSNSFQEQMEQAFFQIPPELRKLE